MKSNVIRIGNSRGVRIPKALLEQCCLGDAVEMQVRAGALVIRPARRPRTGWAEAFSEMARRSDDALLDAGGMAPTRWENDEWRW